MGLGRLRLNFVRLFCVSLILSLWSPIAIGSVLGCAEYKNFTAQQVKTFRDLLTAAEADPIDKFFAFEELYCSNSPPIRAYAAKTALATNSDPIVRQQIMLKMLLAKKRIIVEISPAADSTENDRKFIETNQGTMMYLPDYTSESEGCVSWRPKCEVQHAFLIKGDEVEFADGNTYGHLRLTDSNQLVGSIRLSRSSGWGLVRAAIKLE